MTGSCTAQISRETIALLLFETEGLAVETNTTAADMSACEDG